MEWWEPLIIICIFVIVLEFIAWKPWKGDSLEEEEDDVPLQDQLITIIRALGSGLDNELWFRTYPGLAIQQSSLPNLERDNIVSVYLRRPGQKNEKVFSCVYNEYEDGRDHLDVYRPGFWEDIIHDEIYPVAVERDARVEAIAKMKNELQELKCAEADMEQQRNFLPANDAELFGRDEPKYGPDEEASLDEKLNGIRTQKELLETRIALAMSYISPKSPSWDDLVKLYKKA